MQSYARDVSEAPTLIFVQQIVPLLLVEGLCGVSISRSELQILPFLQALDEIILGALPLLALLLFPQHKSKSSKSSEGLSLLLLGDVLSEGLLPLASRCQGIKAGVILATSFSSRKKRKLKEKSWIIFKASSHFMVLFTPLSSNT